MNSVNNKYAVYFKYDINNPPEKLHNSTRFILISDTHNRTFHIPDGDILIHAGDLTFLHKVNYDITARWLVEECDIKYKVFIAGNHDKLLLRDGKPYSDGSWNVDFDTDYDPQAIDSLCGKQGVSNGLFYLQNNTKKCTVGDRTWNIFGSPLYSSRRPTEHTAKETLRIVNNFPPMDVLITHGPPRDILDKTKTNLNVGCVELTEALHRLKPILHVYGHIHESRGYKVVEYDDNTFTIHVNAANSTISRFYNEIDDGSDELDAVIVDISNE
ncbi:Metallo-dependent phosphatase [Wallemia mellicola]|uniref:Metallo-dependent phosphatase n=1 Tax=Wallemia mellicola TaxID=1708541 RepID=A0A4T0MX15_9BASI|nr:Metallo-dependent phosphatase [Wallemia mellicola]TIB91141.1 Metallo-dependent phosphatase [Wallemia mellicola]TIB97253.1 Metallo-dependent phosphatase [Wallemia mellicola]TIC35788.1 Metallo-dependent phosphatase [Wallemia mellicola]TIC40678.1 Metallo-dependent phosphatase [Wallemia mellicola]